MVRIYIPVELARRVREAARNRCGYCISEVMVPYQEHVLPMIPSGHTVRDIIKA